MYAYLLTYDVEDAWRAVQSAVSLRYHSPFFIQTDQNLFLFSSIIFSKSINPSSVLIPFKPPIVQDVDVMHAQTVSLPQIPSRRRTMSASTPASEAQQHNHDADFTPSTPHHSHLTAPRPSSHTNADMHQHSNLQDQNAARFSSNVSLASDASHIASTHNDDIIDVSANKTRPSVTFDHPPHRMLQKRRYLQYRRRFVMLFVVSALQIVSSLEFYMYAAVADIAAIFFGLSCTRNMIHTFHNSTCFGCLYLITLCRLRDQHRQRIDNGVLRTVCGVCAHISIFPVPIRSPLQSVSGVDTECSWVRCQGRRRRF